jgi:hypothetical protein
MESRDELERRKNLKRSCSQKRPKPASVKTVEEDANQKIEPEKNAIEKSRKDFPL